MAYYTRGGHGRVEGQAAALAVREHLVLEKDGRRRGLELKVEVSDRSSKPLNFAPTSFSVSVGSFL